MPDKVCRAMKPATLKCMVEDYLKLNFGFNEMVAICPVTAYSGDSVAGSKRGHGIVAIAEIPSQEKIYLQFSNFPSLKRSINFSHTLTLSS